MIRDLAAEWIAAKALESSAINRRREVEDALLDSLRLNNTDEGTHTLKRDGFVIKVTYRNNRKVDAEALIEQAKKAGISNEMLNKLFRWKPEIAMREWKSAPEEVINSLARAVTTSAGRPSVSITEE